MNLFGQDPRDQHIEALKEEIQYLRQKLDERDQQILALSNAAAYRMLHPYKDDVGAVRPDEAEKTLLDLRNEPFKPAYSLDDIKREMGS